MKKNAVRDKSFAFALRLVRLSQHLQNHKREYVMSKQLLRSGTAIGALVREADQAESRRDFVHKMAIALKEANELSTGSNCCSSPATSRTKAATRFALM